MLLSLLPLSLLLSVFSVYITLLFSLLYKMLESYRIIQHQCL